MLYFNFFIRSKSKKKFELLCFKSGELSEHKFWEFEIIRNPDYLFNVMLDVSLSGSDHAGILFRLGLLHYEMDVNIYDHRHWDPDTNDWENKNSMDNYNGC